ncbi:MAG TPA: hypothetical protein VK585_08590 [Jiangellaceae bacterium]|nr:hypothetical protein [Jiangellaceae bacterium]
MTVTENSQTKRMYRKGDLLRVRSADEILSTLDPDGAVDGLLFMPEMLKYAGREFRVQASAHKTCDGKGATRQMDRTVHLDGLRCDGSAHDGCQAGCLLFWREEWLSPATEAQPQTTATIDQALEILTPNTRSTDDTGESVYRCQATDILRASRPLSKYNPHQYIRDLASGNITLRTLFIGLSVFFFGKYQVMTRRLLPRWLRIRGGLPYPFYQGTGNGARTQVVDVSPRQLVELRTKDEIMPTLSSENRNRGMWFDPEMIPYCGTRAPVERHVQRIIDESTGKMVKLGDCVVLDNVVCQGIYHRFCQRSIPLYWRSAWLRTIDGQDVE